MIEHLIQWHDAFVENFVVGDRVRGSVDFDPGGPDKKEPDPRAHRRLTYAIEGSASLARALHDAANWTERPGARQRYTAQAEAIQRLVLAIGNRFQAEFSDPETEGRSFFLPRASPMFRNLVGLSTNNSQSYLIEGMSALATLTRPPGSRASMRSYASSRAAGDPASHLVREFDFKHGGYRPDAVKSTNIPGKSTRAPRWVEGGPDLAEDGVVRWRCVDLRGGSCGSLPLLCTSARSASCFPRCISRAFRASAAPAERSGGARGFRAVLPSS